MITPCKHIITLPRVTQSYSRELEPPTWNILKVNNKEEKGKSLKTKILILSLKVEKPFRTMLLRKTPSILGNKQTNY